MLNQESLSIANANFPREFQLVFILHLFGNPIHSHNMAGVVDDIGPTSHTFGSSG